MGKLAVNGGTPVVSKLHKHQPAYDDREKNALKRVLDKNQWGTRGDEAMRFAKLFASYCGCEYGISVTNGTISLEIIMRGLGIGYGDEVIVPSYTFYSTISSVAMIGAFPVLADMDPQTYNIDPKQIEKLFTNKTKAVIATHIGGRICDMDALKKICREKGLFLIEDAAHAHGSEWKGKRAGSLSDVASFSFQSSKNLTCGVGGFISTNDYEIFKGAWHNHNAGRCYEDSSKFAGTVLMGTDARMAEWEAAILNVQLERLDEQTEQRQKNAEILDKGLAHFSFLSIRGKDERITRNAYHLYLIKYDRLQMMDISKQKFVAALNAEGIPASCGYNCIHKMKALMSDSFIKSTGRVWNPNGCSLPRTEYACEEEGIWIPGSYLLGEKEDMYAVVEAIDKIKKSVDELIS